MWWNMKSLRSRLVAVMMMLVGLTLALAMPNADPAYERVQFRGKIYYVHKNFFTEYQAALDDCAADGGMLAEIDDIEEYLIIQSYMKNLNSVNGLSIVYMGGTDIVKDGDWRLPYTGTPLPFTDWRCHHPYRSDSYNCLSLGSASNWTMYSSKCNTNSPSSDVRFMCEVHCRQTRPWPESGYSYVEINDKEYWLHSHYTRDAECEADGGRVAERNEPYLSIFFKIAKELPDITKLYLTAFHNYVCVGYNKDTGLIYYRDCTPALFETRGVLCVRVKSIDECT